MTRILQFKTETVSGACRKTETIFDMYVCACLYMCMSICLLVHVEARSQLQVLFPRSHFTSFLKPEFLIDLELTK